MLRDASSWNSARSQNPWSYKEINSASNLSEFGRFFPSQASRWEHNPANTLITACETICRGPSWSPDPQRLWDNKLCIVLNHCDICGHLLHSNRKLIHCCSHEDKRSVSGNKAYVGSMDFVSMQDTLILCREPAKNAVGWFIRGSGGCSTVWAREGKGIQRTPLLQLIL